MAGAIVFALKQAQTEVAVVEVCCKMGIIEATYYNWSWAAEAKENHQLKQLVGDFSALN